MMMMMVANYHRNRYRHRPSLFLFDAKGRTNDLHKSMLVRDQSPLQSMLRRGGWGTFHTTSVRTACWRRFRRILPHHQRPNGLLAAGWTSRDADAGTYGPAYRSLYSKINQWFHQWHRLVCQSSYILSSLCTHASLKKYSSVSLTCPAHSCM